MAERETINPDLKRERQNCSFDPLLITHALDGGVPRTYHRRYIENLALSDKDYEGPNLDFLSREERFTEGIRKEALFGEKVRELGLTKEDLPTYQTSVFGMVDTGMALHRLAFVPVITTQTTPEQSKKWMPLINSGRMMGCYAQTEMGHGSHVRGLETTSTYDAKTQEFVINTPTLSATKWWPGNLGKTSNVALVLAQLFTQGTHKGLYAFLVPIRDMNTHMPLPGIEVGDIGPKYSGDTNDNGYLRMNNIRIPRENMLMRHAQVLEDGTFVKPKNEKLTYSGMLAIRALLPMGAAKALAMATTIATRYACVRRQSELRPGVREPQIIEYVTQQHKLFPLIATAYAMWISSRELKRMHDEIIAELNGGDFSRLIELHGACSVMKAYCTSTVASAIETCRLSCGGHGYSKASGLPQIFTASGVVGSVTAEGEATVLLLQGASTAACLKAYITSQMAHGLETCRLACGGHGYSQASGIPKIFSYAVGGVTAEGEATVMFLQAGRYLMKCAANVAQGKKLDDSTAYLARRDFGKFTYQGDIDLKNLLTAFEFRAARVIEAAAMRLQHLIGEGKHMGDAWNGAGVQLVKAAQAHSEYIIVRSFSRRAQEEENPTVRKVFSLLCAVHAIFRITENAGDFIQGEYMTSSQMDFLRETLLQLYEKMRPDAVGFVDAFDFRDQHLGSVLGRYDGNVYEELFKWAQNSELNKTQVHESFYKYLKPLRESKL